MAATEPPTFALARQVRRELEVASPRLQLPPDCGTHVTFSNHQVKISINPLSTRSQQHTSHPSSIFPPINKIYKILCIAAEPGGLTEISILVDDWKKEASISASCPQIHLPLDTKFDPPTVVLHVLSIKSPRKLLHAWFQNLTKFYFLPQSKVSDCCDLGERVMYFLGRCPQLEIAKFDYYPGSKEYYHPNPISLYYLESFTQMLRYQHSGVNPINLFNQLLLSPTCTIQLMDEDDSFKRPWNSSFPISHHFSHIELVDISVSHHYGSYGCTNYLKVEVLFSNSHRMITLQKFVLESKYSHKIIGKILGFLEFKGIKGSVKTLNFFCNQDRMTAPEGVLRQVKTIAASSWECGHPLREVKLIVQDKSSLNNRCKKLMDSLKEYVDRVHYS